MKRILMFFLFSFLLFSPHLSFAGNGVGMITMFAGNYAPKGYAFCDGQLFAVKDYPDLYSVIGSKFGGDGSTTFALPDLRGRIPLGIGQGPGRVARTLGEQGGSESVTVVAGEGFLSTGSGIAVSAISAMPGYVAVNFLIAVIPDAQGRNPDEEGMIGEIKMSGFNFAARGRLRCTGALQAITENYALFSITGTTFGGDGRTTYALPELRGRFVLHRGGATAKTSRRYVGEMNPYPFRPVLSSVGQFFAQTSESVAQLQLKPPYLGITYSLITQGYYPSRW